MLKSTVGTHGHRVPWSPSKSGRSNLRPQRYNSPSARPLVTQRSHVRSPECSGHTFVTVEKFDEVAKAVGEYAFVTSKLPVILSLEMHC